MNAPQRGGDAEIVVLERDRERREEEPLSELCGRSLCSLRLKALDREETAERAEKVPGAVISDLPG